MNFHQHRQKRHAKAIKALGVDATLIGLAYAAVETVWSIYIFSFFPNESTMGFISAIFTLFTLISLFFTFPLFKKFSPQQLLFFSLGANSIILALFAHVKNPAIFFILGILNAFVRGIRIQSFGVLLRNNSSKNEINKDENFIYFLMNIGWVLGPLIGGYVADIFDIGSVMILASAALLLSVYSITYNQNTFRKEKNNLESNIHVLNNIKDFFKNKKRFLSYCLSGGLEIWWVISYIFLPVIMIEKYGFSVGDVGVFLFAIIVPLLIVEFSMQKKESKNLKKRIGYGYIIASAIAILSSFSSNIYVILGAMVISSFGIGAVEPTVESHFFSVTKEKESKKFYGSFMTAKQVGSFIGKIVFSGILLYFSLQIGILIIGLMTLSLGIWSLKSKK